MQAFDVNANGYMLNEFTHVQNATHVLVARKFPTQVSGFNSAHRDKHEHGPFPGVIMVLHVMFRGGDSERKKRGATVHSKVSGSTCRGNGAWMRTLRTCAWH